MSVIDKSERDTIRRMPLADDALRLLDALEAKEAECEALRGQVAMERATVEACIETARTEKYARDRAEHEVEALRKERDALAGYPGDWRAVEARDLRDMIDSAQAIARPVRPPPGEPLSESYGKVRMHADDIVQRLRHLLSPRQPVPAQTVGQGARDVDPRELATILNLRAEIAEWRRATMLENQDDATPAHLRQHLQDIGDEADRRRVEVIHLRAALEERGRLLAEARMRVAMSDLGQVQRVDLCTRIDANLAAAPVSAPAATFVCDCGATTTRDARHGDVCPLRSNVSEPVCGPCGHVWPVSATNGTYCSCGRFPKIEIVSEPAERAEVSEEEVEAVAIMLRTAFEGVPVDRFENLWKAAARAAIRLGARPPAAR